LPPTAAVAAGSARSPVGVDASETRTGGDVVSHAADDSFTAGLPLDTAIRRPRPGVVLLEVDGEVDTLTASRMEAGLDEALGVADSDDATVVVDLSGVTFLASAGVGLLMAAHDGQQGIHGQLHLTGVAANRAVHHLLEVLGVLARFDIHDDEDDLLRRLTH
jgi:anti-anti-sigma factor